MIKKMALAVVALTMSAMALGAFAPSASAEDGGPSRGRTILAGRGVLDAQGDGLVAVKGKMDLRASADKGILLVKDIAGDAQVDVQGDGGSGEWQGFTAYFGYDGEAQITGSNVAVIIVARDIRLHVVGAGWAFLKGEGTFEANNRGPFRWTAEGAFASVTP